MISVAADVEAGLFVDVHAGIKVVGTALRKQAISKR